MCGHQVSSAHKCQKKALEPRGSNHRLLRVAMWMLEPRPSAKATGSLNHWAISPLNCQSVIKKKRGESFLWDQYCSNNFINHNSNMCQLIFGLSCYNLFLKQGLNTELRLTLNSYNPPISASQVLECRCMTSSPTTLLNCERLLEI